MSDSEKKPLPKAVFVRLYVCVQCGSALRLRGEYPFRSGSCACQDVLWLQQDDSSLPVAERIEEDEDPADTADPGDDHCTQPED